MACSMQATTMDSKWGNVTRLKELQQSKQTSQHKGFNSILTSSDLCNTFFCYIVKWSNTVTMLGWVDPSVYKKCSFPMNFSKHKTSAPTKMDGKNAHNCSRGSGLAQKQHGSSHRTDEHTTACASGHTTLYCGPPGLRPLSSVPQTPSKGGGATERRRVPRFLFCLFSQLI